MSLRIYQLIRTIINVILGIIAFFLILRLTLRLFSANTATPVVQWIYGISNFLITPFAGIVPNINIQTGILDLVAIIALLVYLAAGYLLLGLIRNFAGPVLREEEYPEEEYIEGEYPRTAQYHDVRRARRERQEARERRERRR